MIPEDKWWSNVIETFDLPKDYLKGQGGNMLTVLLTIGIVVMIAVGIFLRW